MPRETEHFRCPLCGQHAPIERLDEGPFSLEVYHKILGGKIRISEAERERRKGTGTFHRGSSPGDLQYPRFPTSPEVKEKTRRQLEAIRARIDELLEEE